MKKVLAIVLTLSILAQGMVNLMLCAYYEINKKEIADKLCVNKNKPGMHCNGQCYLSRQLKKAEENEKHQSSLREKDEVISLYTPHSEFSYVPSFSFISLMRGYTGAAVYIPHIVPDQPPQILA